AVSPDGETVATGHDNATITEWAVATSVLAQLPPGDPYAFSAALGGVSADGQFLAYVSDSSSGMEGVWLWDIVSHWFGVILSDKATTSATFSPDGRGMASAGTDLTVKIWDIASRTVRRTLRNDTGAIEAVRYSPDGQLLAGASVDGTVKLWKPDSGQLEATLVGHTDTVTDLA